MSIASSASATHFLIAESVPALTSGVLAHLDCSHELHVPSCWKLDVMRRMVLHDNSVQFSFNQGPLGQLALKLTRLHAIDFLDIKRLVTAMSDPRLQRGCGSSPLDDDRSIVTAQLKACPPRLNGAVLLSFISRFCDVANMSPLQREIIRSDAYDSVIVRCDSDREHDVQDFAEQDLSSVISASHPLSSFAAWPAASCG